MKTQKTHYQTLPSLRKTRFIWPYSVSPPRLKNTLSDPTLSPKNTFHLTPLRQSPKTEKHTVRPYPLSEKHVSSDPTPPVPQDWKTRFPTLLSPTQPHTVKNTFPLTPLRQSSKYSKPKSRNSPSPLLRTIDRLILTHALSRPFKSRKSSYGWRILTHALRRLFESRKSPELVVDCWLMVTCCKHAEVTGVLWKDLVILGVFAWGDQVFSCGSRKRLGHLRQKRLSPVRQKRRQDWDILLTKSLKPPACNPFKGACWPQKAAFSASLQCSGGHLRRWAGSNQGGW